MISIKAIIFDLDGTLMDSLEDLYLSCNYAMKAVNSKERTRDEVRSFVGNGYPRLIELALKDGKNNPLYEKAVEEGKSWYSIHCNDHTKPYDGILNTLEALSKKGIKCAIVSNKPDPQVKDLCKNHFLKYIPTDFAIGEDEKNGIKRKPHPDSVNKVLRLMKLSNEEALYVGDSDVDIMTAKNAGLKCISVNWGFRTSDFLLENGATNIISKPEELLHLV